MPAKPQADNQLRDALLDPAVLGTIRECVESEETSGFLIYRPSKGPLIRGPILLEDSPENDEDYAGPLEPSALLDPKRMLPYMDSAAEELAHYLEGLRLNFKGKIGPKDLLVWTKWRLEEECDDETDEWLNEIVSSAAPPGERRHRSIMLQEGTCTDYASLNELRKHHENAVYIRGRKLSPKMDYVDLLVLRQKVPYMNLETFATASMADLLSAFLQDTGRLREASMHYYGKQRGLLDAGAGELQLEDIHPRRRC